MTATDSATKAATIERLVLTTVLGGPIAFVGVLHAGAAYYLLPFLVPPLYLSWVWLCDMLALARGFFGAHRYFARPWYRFFLGGGAALVVVWMCLFYFG